MDSWQRDLYAQTVMQQLRIMEKPMFTDMMLDIETLDSTPQAAILSIGAIAFNRTGGDEANFYERCVVDFSKYDVSYSTFKFWMEQSDEARKWLFVGAIPLRQALEDLRWFYNLYAPNAKVWSLGGNFDPPIVENACRVEGETVPWKYNAVSCVRTLCDLAHITKEERVKPLIAHDALADCEAQVATLRVALQRITVR